MYMDWEKEDNGLDIQEEKGYIEKAQINMLRYNITTLP